MNTVESPVLNAANSASRIAARYLSAWNATDSRERDRLVREAFSSEVHYLDPMMEGRGHDGMAALIAGAQQRFAGYRFVLLGTPEGHHSVVRFSWALAAPGPNPWRVAPTWPRWTPTGACAVSPAFSTTSRAELQCGSTGVARSLQGTGPFP